jgi:hypothetical protein
MPHTFKGRCTENVQDTNGYHVATLVGESGETATVPSKDLAFVVGELYQVSVDGKFYKPVPVQPVHKPEPVPHPATPKVTVSHHKP